MVDPLAMFWWLIVGHAVADYWAQSDWMAKTKNPFGIASSGPRGMWFYALTSHALMHGAAVAFVTGSISLGICEAIAHWVIDFGKCGNFYGIHVDQIAHVVCKVAWVLIAGSGVTR